MPRLCNMALRSISEIQPVETEAKIALTDWPSSPPIDRRNLQQRLHKPNLQHLTFSDIQVSWREPSEKKKTVWDLRFPMKIFIQKFSELLNLQYPQQMVPNKTNGVSICASSWPAGSCLHLVHSKFLSPSLPGQMDREIMSLRCWIPDTCTIWKDGATPMYSFTPYSTAFWEWLLLSWCPENG